MGGFFFVYTMAVLGACLGASFLQFSAAGATRKQTHVALASFFFSYVLELGCIFLEEFLAQNRVFPQALYYEVLNPAARTVISGLLLGSLWAAALFALERFSTVRLLSPVLALMTAQTLCVAALPYGPWRQFLYYACRQVFVAGALAYAAWTLRRPASPSVAGWRGVFSKAAPLFGAALALIALEDVFVILLLDPDAASALPLYLSERNFAENVAVVALAVAVSRRALEELQFRLRQPPVPLAAEGADRVFNDHVGERMPRFSQAHGLTCREQEVLELLLQGKSNTEMADALFLSVGTVKTHVHNIMKKVGSGDREKLRETFWAA